MKKSKITFLDAALLAASISIASVGFFSYQTIVQYINGNNENLVALEQQIVSGVRYGYKAATDIKMGQVISESSLVYTSNMISDVDQSLFIDASDIGKVASISIQSGMPVYKFMVTDAESSGIRERECSFIWLNTNLSDYDNVDVRILFPNGEDYVVCAKKAVHDLRIEINNVFLHLTEEEIQLLDSAIVDANMHNARIYVTKYTNPSIQSASKITYSPSSDVMRVIAQDSNIVDVSAAALSVSAREAMDKRLSLFEEAYPDFTLEYEAGNNSRYSSN